MELALVGTFEKTLKFKNCSQDKYLTKPPRLVT